MPHIFNHRGSRFPQAFRTSAPNWRQRSNWQSVTIDGRFGYLPKTDPYLNSPEFIAEQLSQGITPDGFVTGVRARVSRFRSMQNATIHGVAGFLPRTSGYFQIPQDTLTTIYGTGQNTSDISNDALVDETQVINDPVIDITQIPPIGDQNPPLGPLADAGTPNSIILGDCDSTGYREVWSSATPRQSVLVFLDVLGDHDASRGSRKFNGSPFSEEVAQELGTVPVNGVLFPESEGWVKVEVGGLEPSAVTRNMGNIRVNIAKVLNDPIARELLQENHPTYWSGSYGGPEGHISGNQLPLPTHFYSFARGYSNEAVGPFFQESAGTNLSLFDSLAGDLAAQVTAIGSTTGSLEDTGVLSDPRFIGSGGSSSDVPAIHLNHVQHVIYYTREVERQFLGLVRCNVMHNHGGGPPPDPTTTPRSPQAPQLPPGSGFGISGPWDRPIPTPSIPGDSTPPTPVTPIDPTPPVIVPVPVILPEPIITARGGYHPEVVFFGGDVRGATATATVSDIGTIENITMSDVGGAIRSGRTTTQTSSLDSPKITLSTPDLPTGWFAGRDLIPSLAVSDEDIKAVYEDNGITITEDQLNSLIASRCGYFDPLAQTFLVPETNESLGIFISSIDVCFKSKPNALTQKTSPSSVVMEIRPCTAGSGTPSRDYVVDCSGIPARSEVVGRSINIASGRGNSGIPSFNENGGFTKFKFPVPVYIEPNKRYAIVLMANDSAYKVWINNVSQILITDGVAEGTISDRMITTSVGGRKNHGGTLFKAHSGSQTWEEDLNSDMMFRINRCDFTPTSGQTDISVGQHLSAAIDYGSVYFNPNYGSGVFTPSPKNATVEYSQYQSVAAGSTSLVAIDEFSANRDTTMPSAMQLRAGLGTGDFKITANLNRPSSTSSISPVINIEDWQCLFNDFSINAGGITDDMIEIVGGGSGYAVDNSFTVTGGGGIAPGAIIKVVAIDVGGVITKMQVTSGGSGFSAAAIISESSVDGTGAVIRILGEEGGETGGNASFRYISKKISLSSGMDATDLRAFITARMPKDTSIHVYYRILSSTDSESMDQKHFQKLRQTNPSLDHRFNTFREFEFDTGGDDQITYLDSSGASYSDFDTFQIKIVGYSSSNVKIPSLRDIRAIAVT